MIINTTGSGGGGSSDVDEKLFKYYYDLCSDTISITRDSNGDISQYISVCDGITATTDITKTSSAITWTTTIVNGNDTYIRTKVYDKTLDTMTTSYTKNGQ